MAEMKDTLPFFLFNKNNDVQKNEYAIFRVGKSIY